MVTAFFRFQILSLLATIAVLASCAQPTSSPPALHAAIPVAFKLREQTESHTLQFGSDGGASRLERDRLDAFIADLAIKRPDALNVTVGGTGDDAQLQATVRMLTENGIDPAKIVLAPLRQGTTARDQVTIEINLYHVDAPACTPWNTVVIATDDDSAGRPDLGCADRINLSAMVADPRDLMKGSTTPYADGITATTAVQRYHEDDVKPLPQVSGFGAIPKGGSSAGSGASPPGTSGGM